MTTIILIAITWAVLTAPILAITAVGGRARDTGDNLARQAIDTDGRLR